MRRPVKNRREAEADSKYSSILVSKIINKVMRAGKKSLATHVVYRALIIAEKQLGKSAPDILTTAMENTAPNMELRSRRVGGANYQVPIEVRPERRMTLAIRWIIDAARSQKGKPMEQKLAEELVHAFNNTGTAVKKKQDTHRMAEANKAFAHFAWNR